MNRGTNNVIFYIYIQACVKLTLPSPNLIDFLSRQFIKRIFADVRDKFFNQKIKLSFAK